jgi:preprotein translocase subunit YajC
MDASLFTGTLEVTAAQAGGGDDLFLTAIMFLGMFAVVYFLMIRPQKKQRDTHSKLIAALKKGDEVVLSSGIIGKIFEVKDKVVVLDLGKDNRVRVMKQAVTNTTHALLGGGESKEKDPLGGDKKDDDK